MASTTLKVEVQHPLIALPPNTELVVELTAGGVYHINGSPLNRLRLRGRREKWGNASFILKLEEYQAVREAELWDKVVGTPDAHYFVPILGYTNGWVLQPFIKPFYRDEYLTPWRKTIERIAVRYRIGDWWDEQWFVTALGLPAIHDYGFAGER